MAALGTASTAASNDSPSASTPSTSTCSKGDAERVSEVRRCWAAAVVGVGVPAVENRAVVDGVVVMVDIVDEGKEVEDEEEEEEEEARAFLA